jgi:hypothetical protein
LIAGIVISHDQVPLLDAALRNVPLDAAKKYGTPPCAELHGYSIMSAKDPWDALADKFRAKVDIYGAAMRARAIGGNLFKSAQRVSHRATVNDCPHQ